jgi:hypothetical protein
MRRCHRGSVARVGYSLKMIDIAVVALIGVEFVCGDVAA